MPYTDPNRLAEIARKAAEQEARPGHASMLGKMQRKKDVTYDARIDVISHGTFFHPADFDPFTYPEMTRDEVNVVRERNAHIIKSMLLTFDEDLALNDNLDFMVLAQIDFIDVMSSELRRILDRVKGKKAKRQALTDLYIKAAGNVLTLHRDGYECIRHGPYHHEIRKRVFGGH